MKNAKSLHTRIPKELWLFLKKRSAELEMSMNTLVIDWLKKMQEKDNKKDDKKS